MDKENDIFNLLTNLATGERLDGILLGDVAYLEAKKETEDVSAKLKKHGFSEEEIQLVDSLVCAYISQGIKCMKTAYQQGLRDCVCLLEEIGLLGRNGGNVGGI